MRKLVLFDIDGTLLHTDGAAKRAFQRAMLEVYGSTGPIATHGFDGKTDPQIARELLELDGHERDAIYARLDDLWTAYVREMKLEFSQPGQGAHLYPGVSDLLNALAARQSDYCVALLTGNIVQGADIKLTAAGIAHHFAFGAYGNDCERRDGLPPVAVQRAAEKTGKRFEGRNVVVIGDTPADVTCGRALDVFTLAVATGRYTPNDLRAAGAHVVFDDFSNTDNVLDVLSA